MMGLPVVFVYVVPEVRLTTCHVCPILNCSLFRDLGPIVGMLFGGLAVERGLQSFDLIDVVAMA